MAKDYVPSSYDDFYRHYYLYVVKLVKTFGIEQRSAEDVAQSIILKFFENDVLSDYDPERTSSYGGSERKAVFRTLLSGFVSIYVRHYREKQFKLIHREGLGINLESASQYRAPFTVEETTLPLVIEEYESLVEFDLIRSIRAHLATTVPTNRLDKCNLPLLFESVLESYRADKRPSMPDLAEQFGVSTTSIQNWMKRLRVEIEKVIA